MTDFLNLSSCSCIIRQNYKAVKLLMDGIGNRVVAVKSDSIVDYDIFEALQMKKSLNDEYYQIAHEISI